MVALHRLNLEDPYLGLQLVGTVAFAVSGAAVAIRVGMDWLGVAVLAVVTAVLAGLTELHAPYEAARWAGVAITLVLRLLAIRFSWSLPSIPATTADDPGASATK